jgi:diphthamide biosynthesis protein 7
MASDGEATKSLISTTLDLPPSCIEFSPIHPELFVVGTYNLEKQETDNDDEWEDVDGPAQTATAKKPQERNGSLILFKLENDELYVPYRPPPFNGPSHVPVMYRT